ncbi:ribonuclease H-like [Daktulosphaira vitifoliae]|uniref:ribonuclease H-like n=1 Tax=Daktulosphaira vitifoliae TaxID=58002 RepID=UPI0021A97FFB|nr:ribonuclease H-like [Daktulosphaira vitifoliae]
MREYPLDYIKPVLKNNIPYKVEITTRIEWNINHLTDKEGFVIYTDGSKKSGKVGAGIWGLKPRINVSMSLRTTPSVFQAEVMAILVEAQNLLVYKNRKITILSDSQATLKALCNNHVNSKLILESRETLESLSRIKKVTLAWVQRHNGVTGNENADFIARKGAEKNTEKSGST